MFYVRLLTFVKPGKRSAYLFCLLVIFNCIIVKSYSQQGNTWYFGRKAGLSFNTSPPTPLTDGQMNTFEGCASISDSTGQILFYTDGVTVWNRLHQVMTNGTGLKGYVSSTNSAIIVPKPGSTTIFFIFTAAAIETSNEGYFFSEVDMSLQGGLGAVTANKNILLHSPSTEKLTAVRNSNGVDVWIITRVLNSPEWNVYKVDCNGVNTTPVVSNTGFAGGMSALSPAGCLKGSPDGTKIAAVNSADASWELLDFDASTGKLSNDLVFPETPVPYGVEFSPNSKLVYIGDFILPGMVTGGGVHQFNISTHDSASIDASRTLVGMSAVNDVGALQLGPDNKIYVAIANAAFLSVINAPDSQGVACRFIDRQLPLANTTPSGLGLPPFLPASTINAEFSNTADPDCRTVHFSASTTIKGPVDWQWHFEDGSTGTGQNISHIYTSGTVGTDSVTLTVTPAGTCGFVKVSKKISFDFRKPLARIGYETNCGSLEVSFHDSSTSELLVQSWYWDFDDGNVSAVQNPGKIYSAPGSYNVKFSVQSSNGCVSDTITKTIFIDAVPEASFLSAGACSSLQIQFTNTSTLSFGTISAYAWDFGDGSTSEINSPSHTYSQAGDYTATLTAFTSGGCQATITHNFYVGPVKAFAGNDTIATAGQPVQLQATGGKFYEWSPPDFLNADKIPNPVAVLDRDQVYRVKVTTDEGCIGFDDISIRVLNGQPDVYVPNAFAPNGKNRIFRPILAGIQQLFFFSVYNRWGQLVFTTTEPGRGWDGKINGVDQSTGVYVWILKAKDYRGRLITKNGTVVLIH